MHKCVSFFISFFLGGGGLIFVLLCSSLALFLLAFCSFLFFRNLGAAIFGSPTLLEAINVFHSLSVE